MGGRVVENRRGVGHCLTVSKKDKITLDRKIKIKKKRDGGVNRCMHLNWLLLCFFVPAAAN